MRWFGLAVIGVGVVIAAASCSNGVPLGPTAPASSSASASPAPTPSTDTSAAVAYRPDLQPIFEADCTPCHGGARPAARYSTATYAGVMAAVRPGSASSPLAIATERGGPMYAFLSGDRATKAALISRWILNGAPETR